MLKFTHKLCDEFRKSNNSRQNYRSLNKSIDDLIFSNQKLENRLRNGLETVRKCREDSQTKKDQLNTTIEKLKIKLKQKSIQARRDSIYKNKKSKYWRDSINLDLNLVQNMEPSCFLISEREGSIRNKSVKMRKNQSLVGDNIGNKIYIKNAKESGIDYLKQVDINTSMKKINRSIFDQQNPIDKAKTANLNWQNSDCYSFLTHTQKQQFNNLSGVQNRIDIALKRARKAIL